MNKRDPVEDMGLDPEQYRELLRMFIENTRREIYEIKEALRDNDLNRVEKLAHSFKGAAVSLGLDQIAAAGEAIRDMVRNEHDFKNIESLINKIIQEIDGLSQTV
ncbi:MAG: Hpt domain-containing protein [Desulfobacteraceae bacterium]|nr:Hpt domain-containing protein [Desulfobacteraceae bacterium]